ncbi:unnamed protein product [Larinioides sclopetarius]|uniref:Uncharacterized protein n=1 Tax=Larinioides sclopetarius TaxID=280406 RepID=A0AAV2AB36_9ARAC
MCVWVLITFQADQKIRLLVVVEEILSSRHATQKYDIPSFTNSDYVVSIKIQKLLRTYKKRNYGTEEGECINKIRNNKLVKKNTCLHVIFSGTCLFSHQFSPTLLQPRGHAPPLPRPLIASPGYFPTFFGRCNPSHTPLLDLVCTSVPPFTSVIGTRCPRRQPQGLTRWFKCGLDWEKPSKNVSTPEPFSFENTLFFDLFLLCFLILLFWRKGILLSQRRCLLLFLKGGDVQEFSSLLGLLLWDMLWIENLKSCHNLGIREA